MMINLGMMVMTFVTRMMILMMMVTMGIMQVEWTVMMTVKVYLKMGGSGEPEQLKG